MRATRIRNNFEEEPFTLVVSALLSCAASAVREVPSKPGHTCRQQRKGGDAGAGTRVSMHVGLADIMIAHGQMTLATNDQTRML